MFQLHQEYDASSRRYKAKFNVVEIAEMSPEWVFARTTSEGTTLNRHRNDEQISSFSFFIEDGKFKIACYGFSTTNP